MKKWWFDPFQKITNVKELKVKPKSNRIKTIRTWMREGFFPIIGCNGEFMRQDERHNYYHLYFTADEVEYDPAKVKQWNDEYRVKYPKISYNKLCKVLGENRLEAISELQSILVFDVEYSKTKFKNRYYREFSWILYNKMTGECQTSNNKRISKDVSKDIVIKQIEEFREVLKKADVVVGHNIIEDIKAINCTCINLNIEPFLEFNEVFDTMKESNNLCKLPSNSKTHKYKDPKLIELAKFLSIDTEALHYNTKKHSSKLDAKVTLLCFLSLAERINNI